MSTNWQAFCLGLDVVTLHVDSWLINPSSTELFQRPRDDLDIVPVQVQ